MSHLSQSTCVTLKSTIFVGEITIFVGEITIFCWWNHHFCWWNHHVCWWKHHDWQLLMLKSPVFGHLPRPAEVATRHRLTRRVVIDETWSLMAKYQGDHLLKWWFIDENCDFDGYRNVPPKLVIDLSIENGGWSSELWILKGFVGFWWLWNVY